MAAWTIPLQALSFLPVPHSLLYTPLEHPALASTRYHTACPELTCIASMFPPSLLLLFLLVTVHPIPHAPLRFCALPQGPDHFWDETGHGGPTASGSLKVK